MWKGNGHLPNQQGEVLLIKHHHISNPTLGNEGKLAGEDINQSSQDENVGHESCRAQFRKVTYESEWQKDDELHQDEILDRNDLRAVRDSHDESLRMTSISLAEKVLR